MALSSSPRLHQAGLIVLDAASGRLLRTIALQYNPDSLTRTLQVQSAGGAGGDAERSQPLRLKGPAVETLRLEAEIDATDGLEQPDRNANVVRFGIAPQLAALESLVNPDVQTLLAQYREAASGTLEVIPPEAPLVLFVWGPERVVPVRVSEFSITEQAFDPQLNPMRAQVSLVLRVLSSDDLGHTHRGGGIFLDHLRRREALAGKTSTAQLSQLGLQSLP